MEITELSPTCKVRRIVHNCQDLLNVAVSVIYPSNLLTELSSHIRKTKDIYKIFDLVVIFYTSYSWVEYDIVSVNNFKILFEDSDHEMNCRKHLKKLLKVMI